ncbi:peptidoglycan DD-metalloendopeptidase family protein [Primorskyibacter sp. S187A]|uniref:peptidoglycan DD-metalloendopeptidase family protein n=1 Tax=Primorskyibacter sp. S187A TaxID=3415130 RepID=UPI003C7BCA9A
MTRPRIARWRTALLGTSLLALAACEGQPLDFDMRGLLGDNRFDTAQAAQNATAKRPEPDDRGIISYPGYQVAVARRNDTLSTLAARIGADAAALGRFNGIKVDDPLRAGEIIALPGRVAEPSPATGAAITGPIRPASEIDVSAIAGNAIDNAAPTPVTSQELPDDVQTGFEPVRHKVARGETAFTIARLYNVTVRALADWNSLDRDFTIREGQFLLIPTAQEAAPVRTVANDTPEPGSGSPTPTPPSAATPLPDEVPPAASEPVAAPVQEAPVVQAAAPAATGRMVFPVQGTIIREYAKGRNEGIDISVPAGTAVKAADAGTVAAITSDADQVPIIVVKHPDNLLTVYANVSDISVKKGDSVGRGQTIARVNAGDPAYVHFEVREGFESVDPMPYLR